MDIYEHVSTPEQLDIVLLSAQYGAATRHELHRAYMTHTQAASDFRSFTNAVKYLVRSGVLVTEPHPDPPKRPGPGRPPVLYRLADGFPPLRELLGQLLERLIGEDPDRLRVLESYLQSHLERQHTLV